MQLSCKYFIAGCVNILCKYLLHGAVSALSDEVNGVFDNILRVKQEGFLLYYRYCT